MRTPKLLSLMMMLMLILSIKCETRAEDDDKYLEPDWTEFNKMIDDSLKKDDSKPVEADDDISSLLSPEDEALLDDPNTPQEEKDRILEKVREALSDLIGDLPERLDQLSDIQGDIESSFIELQQSQAEAEMIRQRIQMPDL